MSLSRRRLFALTAASIMVPALPAVAAPITYRLDASRSHVGFGVDLNGDTLTGSMPVRGADVQLDFNQIGNSQVSVTLDAANTRMGVFFATDAVRGPDLLDIARHPNITFRSTSVRQGPTEAEAIIEGNVTIKGMSAPVSLRTLLTQDRATLGQDNPELVFILKGSVDRNAFGITAYKGLVGPLVSLDIRASITRA